MRVDLVIFCATILAVFGIAIEEPVSWPVNSSITNMDRKIGAEQVHFRRKRFVLMPKGGTLKFTCQLAKRLIARVPSGFNFVIEMAFYYPGVSNTYDLVPKKLRKPTTPKPKPTGTTPKLFVCAPGTAFCWKARPATPPPKVHRIDDMPVQWIDTHNYSAPAQHKWSSGNWAKYQKQQQYKGWQPKPGQREKWMKWTTLPPHIEEWKRPMVIDRKQWTPKHANNPNFYYDWHRPPAAAKPRHNQHNDWPEPPPPDLRLEKWQRQRSKRHVLDGAAADDEEDMDEVVFDEFHNGPLMEFPELQPFRDSPHFHGHRDRRQLFFHFEGFSKFLGFDIKSCILRTICECKRFLAPPGFSMVHDIVREIFMFPTISGLEDEYSQAMRADEEACVRQFITKCPISLLDMLLGAQKSN